MYFIIQNEDIINKIIKIMNLNYELNYENNKLIIKLNNNIDELNEDIKYLIDKNIDLFKNKYFNEIFYIINLIFMI